MVTGTIADVRACARLHALSAAEGPAVKACGGRCIVELIRARAYQLYELRGKKSGRELDDWIEAESEIKQQIGF